MVSTRSSSRSQPGTEVGAAPSGNEKRSRARRSRAAHDEESVSNPVLATRKTEVFSRRPKAKAKVHAAKDDSGSGEGEGRNVERNLLRPKSMQSADRSEQASARKSSDDSRFNWATTADGVEDSLNAAMIVFAVDNVSTRPHSGKAISRSSGPSSAKESVPFGSGDFSIFSDDKTSSFLRRDDAVSRLCREVIFDSYCEQSTTEFGSDISNQQLVPQRRGQGFPPMGPVLLLEIGSHFDSDQFWEEIELRNKPLLSYIQRRLRNIQLSHKSSAEKERKQHPEDNKELEREEESQMGIEADYDGTRSTRGIEETGETGKDLKFSVDDADTPITEEEGSPPKRRVTFSSELREHVADKGRNEKRLAKVDSIEDGFFCLADMESFADDAEQLAIAGKLVESDDEQSGDEVAMVVQTSTPKRKGAENSERLRYADFFDPPVKVDTADSTHKATKVSQLLETSESSELSDEESVDTPLTASRTRTRQFIEAIEEENVGKKPWQLRGEVSGHARPKDSLLDADMDHDSTARSGLFTGNERNETIEDLIRQRIADRLFDDVVSSFPEQYVTRKESSRDALPDISQEKPSEGLADLYAREFILEKERAKNDAHVREVKKETDVETTEQKEINRLYEKLASKLDALTGLHFALSNDKTSSEMTVQGKIMALTSEEAIPMGVSDANVLTPREAYSVDKKALAEDKEVTKTERRATRARVKRGMKKSTNAKRRAAQLMQQSNPLSLEKRRAEEAFLRRGKKMRSAAPQVRDVEVKQPYSAPGSKENVERQGHRSHTERRSASNMIL